MSKDQARLNHLLARLEAKYGEHDEDVLQLRQDVQRLETAEADLGRPLRYVDMPPFADRATRLANVRLTTDPAA